MVDETDQNRVRDEGFAQRLGQACDANPHCPTLYQGRLTWISSELQKQFDTKVSVESVRKWSRGIVKPRQKKCVQLAQLLGVDFAWLYTGSDPHLNVRERKVQNATASGAINVIAGFIQMDGGFPAFPTEDDERAKKDSVDLYAIIRGAKYSLHVSLGRWVNDTWQFPVPAAYEHVLVLGVVRGDFQIDVVELTPELIADGTASGGSVIVSLSDKTVEAVRLENFTSRL